MNIILYISSVIDFLILMLFTDASTNQTVTSPMHDHTLMSDTATQGIHSESEMVSSDTSTNEATNVSAIYTAQTTKIVSNLTPTNSNTTQSSTDNGSTTQDLTTTKPSFPSNTTNKDSTITDKASTIDETTSDVQTSTLLSDTASSNTTTPSPIKKQP